MSIYKGSNKIMGSLENVPITSTINESSTNEECAGALATKTELDKKIDKTSIATTIDNTCTDEQVPSAKAVYDAIESITIQKIITAQDCNIEDYLSDKTVNTDVLFTSNATTGDLVNLTRQHLFLVECRKYRDHLITQTAKLASNGVIVAQRSKNWWSGTWSKWTKICTTNVADVPTTTITSYTDAAISTGTLTYRVMNGICYVDVSGINVANNDKPYIIYDSMPKCAFIQRAYIKDANGTYKGGLIITTGSTSLKIQVVTTGTVYGSFSYPVAES